jgi:phosphoribosylaminoimidazole (AIR) synthetase
MYRVFNMGLGMVVIVAGAAADTVLTHPALRGEARVVGEVVTGFSGLELVPPPQ